MQRKIALVTGAAKGIGKSLITELAKNGYDVVINYLSSEKLAMKLKKEVEEKYNVKALTYKCDVTNELEVIKMIDEVKDVFGKIDILINNAAFASDNYLVDKTKEEFMRVLEVNLVGPFLVSKYASKYMDNGVIVNISSKDAISTYNEISIDYCASKAGLNSLTKTLSLAIKNNKVIAVMPGWVETESVKEMNPDYLKSELERINQKKLATPLGIVNQIINVINDKSIKTGSIIELDDE